MIAISITDLPVACLLLNGSQSPTFWNPIETYSFLCSGLNLFSIIIFHFQPYTPYTLAMLKNLIFTWSIMVQASMSGLILTSQFFLLICSRRCLEVLYWVLKTQFNFYLPKGFPNCSKQGINYSPSSHHSTVCALFRCKIVFPNVFHIWFVCVYWITWWTVLIKQQWSQGNVLYQMKKNYQKKLVSGCGNKIQGQNAKRSNRQMEPQKINKLLCVYTLVI